MPPLELWIVETWKDRWKSEAKKGNFEEFWRIVVNSIGGQIILLTGWFLFYLKHA